MMTGEKANPDERRIIVDMSFPHGESVNSGILRREYLGFEHKYSLLAVSCIGDKLRLMGRGS